MKARTKAQREVVELTATLPPFDERDLRDAKRGYALIYAGARTAWCSCCGSVWESGLWNSRKEHDVCPHCGARGKVVKSANKRTSDEKYYVSFVRVVGDWQVIRTAICRRITEKGESEIYWTLDEVFQRWMRPGTNDVIVGRGVHGMCSWTGMYIQATALMQGLEYFDTQFSNKEAEADWRFSRKRAANEIKRCVQKIRDTYQHTFMEDHMQVMTGHGTREFDVEAWDTHEEDGRKWNLILYHHMDTSWGDERAEADIVDFYENRNHYGIFTPNDYRHWGKAYKPAETKETRK